MSGVSEMRKQVVARFMRDYVERFGQVDQRELLDAASFFLRAADHGCVSYRAPSRGDKEWHDYQRALEIIREKVTSGDGPAS